MLQVLPFSHLLLVGSAMHAFAFIFIATVGGPPPRAARRHRHCGALQHSILRLAQCAKPHNFTRYFIRLPPPTAILTSTQDPGPPVFVVHTILMHGHTY